MTDIHPTAVVAPGAELAEGVVVGPYCVIGEGVRIGARTRLHAHVVVTGRVQIGPDCEIYPFAAIGGRSQDRKSRGIGAVVIGEGTVVREYVTIHGASAPEDVTRVGRRCLLMAGCHVAHDCVVGDEVIMANGSALGGHVEVEDQAILGGLSGVHQFARLGRLCIVGACSKVTQDVPPFMMADGHPLRVVGINRVGLVRRGVPETTRRWLKEAYRWLYREKLTRRQALDRIERELPPLPEIRHLLEFCRSTKRGLA